MHDSVAEIIVPIGTVPVDGIRKGVKSMDIEHGQSNSDRIRSFVQRVERLEEEKTNLAEDIKEVYAEAKWAGFDTKILRKCVQIRKKDPQELSEEDALLELYLDALGDDK